MPQESRLAGTQVLFRLQPAGLRESAQPWDMSSSNFVRAHAERWRDFLNSITPQNRSSPGDFSSSEALLFHNMTSAYGEMLGLSPAFMSCSQAGVEDRHCTFQSKVMGIFDAAA